MINIMSYYNPSAPPANYDIDSYYDIEYTMFNPMNNISTNNYVKQNKRSNENEPDCYKKKVIFMYIFIVIFLILILSFVLYQYRNYLFK